MDPVQSGTGVFYQAMPAIGANGKNIMKLIPVQMVNGRFVQTQISKPKTNPTPQKEVTFSAASALVEIARKESLNPFSSQQPSKKQVSLGKFLPGQVEPALSNPVNQQAVKLNEKVPQMAATSTNMVNSARLPFQLPVMVKSPALPRGQCLQILPTAQVQRVPASQLPPRVKEQIFTSSSGSPAGSGSNSVVYVSPVTTVNQGPPESSGSASHTLRLLSQATNTASPSGAKPHLKLIPKVSQRPNSPIRWVIEEVDSSTAENRRHPLSPSVTSEIIQSVAERENKSKLTVPQPGPRNDGQGQENALVVCNGKVFFVANKCSSSFKSTAATQSPNISKSTIPPPPPPPPQQQPHELATPQTKPSLRAPGESSEVIDLCDDDDDSQQDLIPQASSSNTPSASHPDEDNVIFVSYIPPKSQSMPKTQAGIIKQTDWTASSGSNSRAGVSAQRGVEPGQNISVGQESHDAGSTLKSLSMFSIQQLDNMEVDEESPADHSSSGEHPETEESSQSKESCKHPRPESTSLLVPRLCQRSDSLLRKMFGITADVKISLQKIDEASPGCVSADLHQGSMRSVEDEKPISSLKQKDLIPQDMCSAEDRDVCISVKMQSEQELSASLHTRVTPLKSSHFKLNSEPASGLKESCCSGQSSHNRVCHAEPDAVLGYVEPIDEDFPDENDMPTLQSSPSYPQPYVDMNTNTRRMGRTRKRTMCPCCIPTALHPAVKSSSRLEEPETLTTEQTSKKTGRRAPRKDGKTSGRISCLEAKNKHNCKTHEALSTTSTCELKRHEKGERLKDLLSEEEAQKMNHIS
ncbi:ligand-dependent nuclear receptor-interacting factor 1 [Melanotaenia boesemani]|uniref:ligand-dependent nuclear receptor-interacting factor 1 n=1 Tax=Melanotaenia boesemani TaxID=1250792 RepID=UPI001C04CF45|nr:ligand-dependent nuclear receptor-interacting factor 1 [Melanotaenia boesemani]